MSSAASTGEMMGDAALVARIATHDAAAFRLLVDRHAEVARRIAYRMLGDAAEAEDIAQESMLRLWERAGQWKQAETGVGGWIRRVAINLCFDRLRRRRFVSDEPVPERADEAPPADLTMDAAQTRAIVLRCLDALGEQQRAAIVLTYYEDLTNIVAADTLNLNIKAFESLLLRARHALRKGLVAAGIVELTAGNAA